MANAALIVAGSRITASLIASISPLEVIKPADQPLTSSTALQNDTALLLPVAAGASYDFTCYLDYEGGTQGSSDIKWLWSVPSGAALRYHGIHDTTGGAAVAGTSYTGATTVTAGTNGAGNLKGATMIGTLVTAGTSGTILLTWAQNTSSATATIVHAQSKLSLVRIT